MQVKPKEPHDGQRPFVGALAIVLLALAFAACGKDSADGPSSPAVGSAFRSRALAVCDAAFEMKEAQGPFPYPDFNPTQPDPSKLPEIAPFLAKTATTFDTWEREMKALGQPPSGQAAWAELVQAVEDHARIAAEQATAAERGDTETFTKDYYEGTHTQPELLKAANDAGVPECARVDR